MRAKARESERLSYALNPAAGTMLAAPAGGQAEAEFDFYNDSPDVASFYLEVDGLGPDWASGVGTAYEAYAPSSGGGQLRLTLTPPITSSVGEYDFRVRLMSGGVAVNDGTALILRVDPPLDRPAETAAPPPPMAVAPPPPVAIVAPPPIAVTETNGASAVETPVIPIAEEAAPKTRTPRTRAAAKQAVPEPPLATVETFEPEPVTPPTVLAMPEPVAPVFIAPARMDAPVAPALPMPPPVVEEPPPAARFSPSPEPIPRPTPTPAPSGQQAASAPPTPVEPVQPAPVPTRPVSAPTPPAPPPVTPTRPAAPPPPVTPTRPAAPPPPADEPVLVDYQPHPTGAAGQAFVEDEEDTSITEPFLLDPKDGSLVPLRPGETMLLRFPFVNEATRERTYILDEDRALEDGWLTLVQDQVNLTRNGQGELSVRLTPPVNADPGDYPFTITTGPQGGQILPRVLTLSVLATPAVQLTTKDKTVKIGPFGSDVVFPISVESAGNADTSFRIAVKSPQNEATDGGPVGSGDVYESGPWRYLFDKEMETLRSPMAGQTPRPVPVSLRVRRKGVWWFGFKEQHPLRVAAVPVTEPGNGGKTGNSLDLVAVRTRFLPFPWPFLAALLLLIALFQSGGPTDLSVTDAAYSNGTACWIVAPKDSDNKKITMTWTSKSLALLRFIGAPQGQEDKPPVSEVKAFSGTYSATVPVSTDHRDVIYHYRIGRLLGGAYQDILAHFIYTSASTPLQVTNGATGGPLPGGSGNVTLTVPASGLARLDIKNMAPKENRLDWWLVKGLDANSANKFSYIKSNGSLEPGATEHFLIRRNPGGANAGSDEQIVLITTDANHPVLTVTLKPGP